MVRAIRTRLRSITIVLACLSVPFLSCRREGAEQPTRVTDSPVEEPFGPMQQTAETVPSPDQPDIQFDVESHDFGTIFQMRTYEHVFTFRNAGTARLIVENAMSTCGCTATFLSEKELDPGEEAELKVELKSGMYEGPIHKAVMVRSNDPDEPIKKLRIESNVVARLVLDPKRLYFRQVRKSEGATRWIEVKPSELEEVESVEVKCTTKHFSTELEPAGGEGERYRVRVAVADDAPLGRITGAIEFFLNGETEPCTRAPVSAHLLGDIDISPTRLLFRAKQGSADDLGAVDVTSGTGRAFRILAVSNDIPSLETRFLPVEEGKQYSVIARLVPDAPLGRVRGSITIRTDGPYHPEIVVPVFGMVE